MRPCIGKSHTESFTRVFIDNGQHLVWLVVTLLIVNEVDRSDVVWSMRPELDDRGIVVVKPHAALMAFRNLQPFFSPDPLSDHRF